MSPKLQQLERMLKFDYPTRKEFEALVAVAKAAQAYQDEVDGKGLFHPMELRDALAKLEALP